MVSELAWMNRDGFVTRFNFLSAVCARRLGDDCVCEPTQFATRPVRGSGVSPSHEAVDRFAQIGKFSFSKPFAHGGNTVTRGCLCAHRDSELLSAEGSSRSLIVFRRPWQDWQGSWFHITFGWCGVILNRSCRRNCRRSLRPGKFLRTGFRSCWRGCNRTRRLRGSRCRICRRRCGRS